MREMLKFYIDGEWVDPETPRPFDVINPATEEVCGRISLGSQADVDKAVAAANRAAPGYAETSREERNISRRPWTSSGTTSSRSSTARR